GRYRHSQSALRPQGARDRPRAQDHEPCSEDGCQVLPGFLRRERMARADRHLDREVRSVELGVAGWPESHRSETRRGRTAALLNEGGLNDVGRAIDSTLLFFCFDTKI